MGLKRQHHARIEWNKNHISAGNMRHTPARQFASQIVGGAGMALLPSPNQMNKI
jgi:hypothetical protein